MIKNKAILQKYLKIVLVLMLFVFATIMVIFPEIINLSSLTDNSPTNAALKYYHEKYGDGTEIEGIRVTTLRLGCHEEIRVYKGNELLMRATYSSGRIYEI